jgi:hypothetical protein
VGYFPRQSVLFGAHFGLEHFTGSPRECAYPCPKVKTQTSRLSLTPLILYRSHKVNKLLLARNALGYHKLSRLESLP